MPWGGARVCSYVLVTVLRAPLPCSSCPPRQFREASADGSSPPANSQLPNPVRIKAAPPLRPQDMALIERVRHDAAKHQRVSGHSAIDDEDDDERVNLAPVLANGQLADGSSTEQGRVASPPFANGQEVIGTAPRWRSPQPALEDGRASIAVGQEANRRAVTPRPPGDNWLRARGADGRFQWVQLLGAPGDGGGPPSSNGQSPIGQ